MPRARAWTTSRGAHIRRAAGALIATALAGVCLAPAALAGPAVNEYSLDLPDAKGKVESPQRSPVIDRGALPPNVASRLERSPSGKALATIASAGELGAPSSPPGGSRNVDVAGNQPSAVSAVGSSLGDPAVIGLILLLALAGGTLVLTRRARGTRAR